MTRDPKTCYPAAMRGERIDVLLSLPPAGVAALTEDKADNAVAFADSDPPGRQLGSGGGTVNLLARAWQRQVDAPDFPAWLDDSRKLVVHGSGQSRRLPAYAAEGKPMLPLPLRSNATGQAPDQRLLDLQLQTYRRLFRHAPSDYRVMIGCGDVHVRDDHPPAVYPRADVLIVGIPSSPEEASRHGVMFCSPDDSHALRFFLQKPSPERIRTLSADHRHYLDTGIWLLSRRAVSVLFSRSGWRLDKPRRDQTTLPYELFDRFATALGSRPSEQDRDVRSLTAAVLPLSSGRFYHFGTNASLLASVAQLAAPEEERRAYGHGGATDTGGPVILNAQVRAALGPANRQVWIENATVPAGWKLAERHVITGVPENAWSLDLPSGTCLDAAGVSGAVGCAWRVYGFDDEFRGRVDDARTLWFGRPVTHWLAARGLAAAAAGLDPAGDIQQAPLFPLLPPDDPRLPGLIAWMIAAAPPRDDQASAVWLKTPRVSAAELLIRADVAARRRQRLAHVVAQLSGLAGPAWRQASQRLDLEAVAAFSQRQKIALPAPEAPAEPPSLADVHDAMLRVRMGACEQDRLPFERLRDILVNRMGLQPLLPRRNVLDDQIVWARSPVRLDIAGGWTDTPPYCLEHGGRVVNVAVNLNGQPPIQVFARLCDEPHLVLRSIDLGVGETLTTYAHLRAAPTLGGGFGIARAALRLAGFDPLFHAEGGRIDLATQLRKDFGGGLEVTMLAAIPKGSGLGTSSMLAAALLAALSDICGLGWSNADLFMRTLVLEQILTSGGGWQDQVGGIAGGVKLIETSPGLVQRPVVRWLPPQVLADALADRRLQLYYTGITRVAHSILGEIVRGIFLNDAARLEIVNEIGLNADFAVDALQRQAWPEVCETVSRSWRLNRALDSGTNPPAVQAILDRVTPWLASAKLLGAGGGGYLMLLSGNAEDGRRLRQELLANPPNPRARFVEGSISETGLQVTRS